MELSSLKKRIKHILIFFLIYIARSSSTYNVSFFVTSKVSDPLNEMGREF